MTMLIRTFFVAYLLVFDIAHAETSVAVMPQTPFVEATPAGLSTNFDILVRNDEKTPVEITEVAVLLIGDRGQTLFERRIDENGSAPSIETLGQRVVPTGTVRLIFNPFPVAPIDIHPSGSKIRVTLTANPDADHPATKIVETSVKFRMPPPEAQALLLPLAGHVLVWDGHDLLSHHRRWDYELPTLRSLSFTTNGMRYAYDLVRIDDDGNRVHGDVTRNQNHLSFNLPVRSPADGTVVDIETAQPDDGSADFKTFKSRPNLMFGNYIVVKHADGVYSLLGHLHQTSAMVRVGDPVKAGQVLARVGCSGTCLFPHLHYQLMTGPTMAAEGVPSTFRDVVRVRGPAGQPSPSVTLDSGDVAIAK